MPDRDPTGFVGKVLPGLIVAVAVAALAWILVWAIALLPPPVGQWPVSAMLVAILIGLALSALARKQAHWTAGLDLVRDRLLKLAVALIGLRLSLVEVGRLGLEALPLVIVAVLLGLFLAFTLVRLAGGGTRLSLLLGVGTAICGASAIAATAPGLRARADETGYAIACVVLIGLAATVAYPLLLQHLVDSPEAIGLVLGVAIHDTAQVTAAAVMHEQVSGDMGTLEAATVAKLIRNAGMLLLIPTLVWAVARRDGEGRASIAIPWFIVGFVALAGIRSLGDAWLGAGHPAWQTAIGWAGAFSLFAFTMAMAALAMAVSPSELRAIGWKPALAALLAAVGMFTLALIWVT
jgi:uncharacterized integral membrane protein (TIGR00698 family)